MTILIMLMLLTTVTYGQGNYEVKKNTQSKVQGLENAMLKVQNNETIQVLEQVMNKIQEKNRERLRLLQNLTFEEKEGKFFSYGKAEAKFLNIIPFKKQVKYEIDEDGNMERKKSFFSFLWKFNNKNIEGEE